FHFARRRSRRWFLAEANARRKDEKRSKSDCVAHPPRMLASASRDRELFLCDVAARDSRVRTRLFRRDAETNTRDACATRKTRPNWTIFHNKLPPTQLRELDLLGSHRFGAYSPPSQPAGSSSSHSSFCEEVFSRVAA